MKKIFILSIILLLSNLVRGQMKTENDGFRWQMYSEDGFIGAKNEKGKIIVPAVYNTIRYHYGNFIAKKIGFYGILSKKGKVLVPANKYFYLKFDENSEDSPFILVSFTSWCAVNKKGTKIIPDDNYEVLNALGDKENGYYFTYSKNGLWGVSDSDGNEIIPFNDCSWIYRDGTKKNGFSYFYGKYGEGSGVYDEKGKILIKTEYPVVRLVRNEKSERCFSFINGNAEGLMDSNGNVIKEGIHFVKKEALSVNKTDSKGKLLCYRICDKNNRYGITTLSGEELIPCDYDWIFPSSSHFIVRKGDLWGVFSSSGKIEKNLEFYNALTVNDHCIIAVKNGMCAAFDFSGKTYLPLEYESIDPLFYRNKKVFLVRNPENHMLGAVGVDGSNVIPFQYDDIRGLRWEDNPQDLVLYIVVRDGKMGICNMDGKEIIAPSYTDISITKVGTKNFVLLTNGNKQGLADFNGRVIIPAEIFTMLRNSDSRIWGHIGKRECEFDLDGNLIHDNLPDVECDKYTNLADEEFEKGHYKKAAEYYGRAIVHRPSASLYFNKGVSLYNISKYEDAVTNFNLCLNSDPSQNLINRSRSLILKSREYQAEKEVRNQQLAANILGLVIGVTNAFIQHKPSSTNNSSYNQSSYKRDTSMDYLLDPNYTIQQVNRENWYEYMRDTNGGKTMSFDEWYANIKAPSIRSTSNDEDDSYSSSSNYSSSNYQNSSRGKECRMCAHTGKCKTCTGRGYYYNPLNLSKTVLCPNCKNHDGRCSACGGTGYQ